MYFTFLASHSENMAQHLFPNEKYIMKTVWFSFVCLAQRFQDFFVIIGIFHCYMRSFMTAFIAQTWPPVQPFDLSEEVMSMDAIQKILAAGIPVFQAL